MSETLSAVGGFIGDNIGKLIPLNLTFEFNKTEIGTILIDVLLSEEASFEGKVTRYPVEDGSVMSDHIFAGSQTLKISGTNSNAEAYSFNSTTRKTRLLSSLETIQMVFLERKLLKVTTALAVYNDMGIENLRVVRSAGSPRDGNWLDITAELRHVEKVTLRRADVQAAEPAAGRTGTTAARTNTNSSANNTSATAATASNPPSGSLANQLAPRAQQLYNSATGYLGSFFGGR